LLIISDGGDNSSRYTEGEIKKLGERMGYTLIYAIGVYDPLFFRLKKSGLGSPSV